MINLRALLHCLASFVWLDKHNSRGTGAGAKVWSNVVTEKVKYSR